MKRLGLYLHIPFCRSKCLYCDFYSLPRPTAEAMEHYVDALCRDLERKAPDCAAYLVDTVYFGGGTPTLLPEEASERILSVIASRYRLDTDAEITAECNPATASTEKLRRLRRAGWNRLSIGIQSIHPKELRALGRTHGFADAEQLFSDATDAGFSNLSADLMFGIPEQTPESWLASLEAVLALTPSHLSFYGLTVEAGTPFAKAEKHLPIPSEEDTRQMYFDGIRMCEAHGLLQYEISNFATPGNKSRHNLKYWNCEEYLGFGPAAFSDFSGVRSGNSRDLAAYIEGRDIRAEEEHPSPSDRMNEYIMLRLRLTDGIREKEFSDRFRCSFLERYREKLLPYQRMKLLNLSKDGCALSPEGFYVSNSILSDLVEFEPS